MTNICKMAAPAVAMLSMLWVSSTAMAAPLNPSHVPADAKWVIHIDLEALTDTALAEQVRQNRPEMVKLVRQWFQNRYGIDPREDLIGVTMFSDSYESHTGAMILKAGYDREKVAAELKNNPNVQAESWENQTIYMVTKPRLGARLNDSNRGEEAAPRQRREPRQNEAGANPTKSAIILLDDQTAVFASSADRAKAVVGLLQGGSPSLEGKESGLLKELAEGAILYGAAVDLKQIAQHEGIFPILRQHEQIYLSVGEKEGEVFRNLTLVAQSEDVAEQMKKSLEGAVAFGKVWSAGSENLTRIVEGVEVTREGNTVHFQGRSDTETVLGALGEVRERLQKRFGAARSN